MRRIPLATSQAFFLAVLLPLGVPLPLAVPISGAVLASGATGGVPG
ncbi:MAG TPA: hypothetical protein VHW47_03035 [Acidimicrobiales bacterium]|nr:hypothetical protein [Acidimicrobiales bacterium]